MYHYWLAWILSICQSCLIVEISLIVSRFGKNRTSQVSSYVFPTPPKERKSVTRGPRPARHALSLFGRLRRPGLAEQCDFLRSSGTTFKRCPSCSTWLFVLRIQLKRLL